MCTPHGKWRLIVKPTTRQMHKNDGSPPTAAALELEVQRLQKEVKEYEQELGSVKNQVRTHGPAFHFLEGKGVGG
jgi:hypothetical protein